MKTLSFDIYSDPGHGWAKVPMTLVNSLGIRDRITSYSYFRNEYAYLEEDCDLSTFIGACKTNGISPVFREKVTNKSSKIRTYSCYPYYRKVA
jgi:hypothetical protein